MNQDDAAYLDLVLEPVRACRNYRPKFGQGGKSGGLTLSEFQALYQSDAFYNWFGLYHPMMYAAHKAAGGMTSVYRQIGIGCERLFRAILRDSLALSDEDVTWSYEAPSSTGKKRFLHLDARVPVGKIADEHKRKHFHRWMCRAAKSVGVSAKVSKALGGAIFEVRQGYKSKDAKRQNADITNAATAYATGYLPCAAILSTQIDGEILQRYRRERWVVLTGVVGQADPLASTYDFMRDVVGYDLADFFRRNRDALHKEIHGVLTSLLKPE